MEHWTGYYFCIVDLTSLLQGLFTPCYMGQAGNKLSVYGYMILEMQGIKVIE